MRAVLVNAPESMPQDRRRLGIDKLDECWQGEWHFENPPKYWHVRLTTGLLRVLDPLALALDLEPSGDGCGVFASQDDFRVPDLTFARRDHITDEGITSAELVIEIRSPGDESYDKLPFYASRRVREVLILNRDRTFELLGQTDAGMYEKVYPINDIVRSAALRVSFSTVNGPALRITWDTGTADV